MERLGLFGGSFNPVHRGHLLVAKAALEELKLSTLFFIPAAQSPFKPAIRLAPAEQRLRLLRLALAGQTRCQIDDQELARGGVSYTIDTVRSYAARFPRAELWCLIGSDQLRLLPKWRSADELAGLVRFAVIPRPGEGIGELAEPFRGVSLGGWPISLSASQVRERLKAGLPVDGLVPDAVAEALRNYRLYL